MKTAILFILMMLVLVGPHEFGHMIVAKLCGVKVFEFSIGFGPVIFKKKKGDTQYSLRLIPLGGFCKMAGMDDEEDEDTERNGMDVSEPESESVNIADEDDPTSYLNKTPLQQIAILLAGVTMNVIIALIVTIIAVSISGVPTTTLGSVEKGSPAAVAGLEAGDKIIEIDGVETDKWSEVYTQLNKYDGKDDIDVVVTRDGEELSFEMAPEYSDEAERYMIGIVSKSDHNVIRCIPYGVEYTGYLFKTMIYSFKMIFGGEYGMKDVSGPVGLVQVVDETADYGVSSYLMLLALVSLNLAFVNMIPIPGLDGGKILFIILKAISFGKITDEMEMKATVAGALLLLGLFVLLTVNDISRLIG